MVTLRKSNTVLRKVGLAEAQEYSSEDIGKIAAQIRATHVLRGSFIKAGESIIITAGLQKPGTGETARTLRLEARGDNEIIPKVDELTRQVKEELNLTAAQIAGDIAKELGKITTSSPEALKYYIEGRRHHNKIEYEQAIAYMEKAVEIDPEFAMAYRSMAISHTGLGHRAEARKYMEKALELSDRLPENERLYIEANVFLNAENYAKEIEILERLVKTYPGYLAGWDLLALAYRYVGDIDKAIEHQEFVVQKQKTARPVWNLAWSYMAKGFYQQADDVCRAFLQDVEDNFQVRRLLGWSYLCRRQFDLALAEAEKVYQQVFDKDRASGRSYLYLLALIRGKYREAVSLRQQNLEESKGDKGIEAGTYI